MNFIQQTYLEDTSICDELIAHFKLQPKIIGMCGDVTGSYIVDTETKDSLDYVCNETDAVIVSYIDELQKEVDKYVETYKFCNANAPWTLVQPPNIQYYKPGGGFKKFHCERATPNGIISTRHLVFMTYLNDVTDGGETEFYYQKLKIKPEKGKTVIFPADWTHTHRGVPSMTQDKYIITGWFNYIEVQE